MIPLLYHLSYPAKATTDTVAAFAIRPGAATCQAKGGRRIKSGGKYRQFGRTYRKLYVEHVLQH